MTLLNYLNRKNRKTIFRKKLGKFFYLNKLLKWPLRYFLYKLSAKHIIDNKQLVIFAFDHISHSINLDGIYEKSELDLFFEWINSIGVEFAGKNAIDVGANIGNHSLYFSGHFDQVYSFEPNPRTYKVLSLNADLVTNVSTYNFGLSDVDSIAKLSVNPNNIGASSVTSKLQENLVDIELRTIDSLGYLKNIGLIKIDVEGHEVEVIRGAESLIRRDFPFILFEQHFEEFDNGDSQVVQLLNQIGYKSFATIEKFPRYKSSWILKFLMNPLLGIFFGETLSVKIQRKIKPKFYSFVVALPPNNRFKVADEF